jgi:hypothetical protein
MMQQTLTLYLRNGKMPIVFEKYFIVYILRVDRHGVLEL